MACRRQMMVLALLVIMTTSSLTAEGWGWYHRTPCRGVEQPDPDSCPVSCLISDPVCGKDGNTYYCGCLDAMCSGTKAERYGEC
ncbi:hypothetical protein LINGRAHAP2_LOCUS14997 [Linum grandiflorum]